MRVKPGELEESERIELDRLLEAVTTVNKMRKDLQRRIRAAEECSQTVEQNVGELMTAVAAHKVKYSNRLEMLKADPAATKRFIEGIVRLADRRQLPSLRDQLKQFDVQLLHQLTCDAGTSTRLAKIEDFILHYGIHTQPWKYRRDDNVRWAAKILALVLKGSVEGDLRQHALSMVVGLVTCVVLEGSLDARAPDYGELESLFDTTRKQLKRRMRKDNVERLSAHRGGSMMAATAIVAELVELEFSTAKQALKPRK